MSLLERIEKKQQEKANERGNGKGNRKGDGGVGQGLHSRWGTTVGVGLTGTNQAVETRQELKRRIQDRLAAEMDVEENIVEADGLRQKAREIFDDALVEEDAVLSRVERDELFDQIADEILGLGPLEPLLADDTITEIMVNGATDVYIERDGKVRRTNVVFDSNDQLLGIIKRIVSPLGRRIDESSPYVDARLQDGSRVNAVIPPISLVGPTLTIRKFSKDPLTVEDLIGFGSVTREAMEMLKDCVKAKLNIFISGGTGSGKTTFLNVLSSYIPPDERIITIENAAELQLRQDHVVTLESRPPNIEGKGAVTIRDLVINSLRMRPERIVVGECRGPEAFDMLQAMNTGHEGSMTTIHANNPREALGRVENMVLMAGMDLPHRAIREQIAAALDVVIQLSRMRDGSRKVIQISEVQGMEGDVIVMSDIFKFELVGYDDGRVIGELQPTGLRPKFTEKIEAAGMELPPSIFGVEQRRKRRRF